MKIRHRLLSEWNVMKEEEELSRLWEAFPALHTKAISDYGTESVMVEKKRLDEHLQKVSLYFFRGGVAAQKKEEQE